MLLDSKLHNCYLCSIRPLIDKNNLLIVIIETRGGPCQHGLMRGCKQ